MGSNNMEYSKGIDGWWCQKNESGNLMGNTVGIYMEEVGKRARALLFLSFLIIQSLLMQFQYESLSRDTTTYADSKFHYPSTATALYTNEQPPSLLPHHTTLQDKYPTEMTATAPCLHWDDPEDSLPIEREILQITHRFGRIQQILLQHSARESQLHEKVYEMKEMCIDWNQLSPDLTNKINIIEDLRHLVAVAEQQPTIDLAQSLESKFQEYYLERHYGGLKCEVNDLSIQERDEETAPSQQRRQIDYQSMAFGYAQESSDQEQRSSTSKHSSFAHLRPLQGFSSVQRSQESLQYINLKDDKMPAVSRIGGIASLVNDSKMTYTEDCCQTLEEHCPFVVEVPRFIEVEIPLIVYRVKEKVITYDESDLEVPYNDIDEIIDKYSRPYEQLYLDSDKHLRHPEEPLSRMQSKAHQGSQNNLQVGSIMLDSHVEGVGKDMAEKEMTEVELSYSHLPDEQLMLESYAQIGSLVSNQGSATIVITEKLNSRSILEKFEESERILNEENLQLKEEVVQLKQDLQEAERKLMEANAMGRKLSDRLEEEIQQGVYLAKKLDQLDAELLEEKVDCLTRLNNCKDSKIATLQADLVRQMRQIDCLRSELQEVKGEMEKREELLAVKEQQVAHLGRQLEQQELQLRELTNTEDDIIQIVSQTEISLKEEIQKLEREKTIMREQITQFQKRVESEGFSLQYEEAQEIQGIIQAREHVFSVELKEATSKLEGIIAMYKQELEQTRNELSETRMELGDTRMQLGEARQEVRILNELNHKSELHDTCTTVKEKRLSDNYINQFEAIIEEYDRELQLKDEEILHLRQQLFQVPTLMHQYEQQCLIKFKAIIDGIYGQLQKERQERMRVATRLVEVDRMLADSSKALDCNKLDKYETLVEDLTDRLEKVMSQNSSLKGCLTNMRKQQSDGGSQQISSLRKQVQKLRRVNGKLKKYTLEMESQLVSISGMGRCESHKHIIASLTEQRDYLADQLSKA